MNGERRGHRPGDAAAKAAVELVQGESRVLGDGSAVTSTCVLSKDGDVKASFHSEICSSAMQKMQFILTDGAG